MTRVVRLAIVLAATLTALLLASSAQASVPRIGEHTLTCEGLRAKVEVPITWRGGDALGSHKASVTFAVFGRGDNPSASKAIFKETEYGDLPAKGTQTIVHSHRFPAPVSRKLCSGHATLGIYTSHMRDTDGDPENEIIYLDRSFRFGHKIASPQVGASWFPGHCKDIIVKAGADLHDCDLSHFFLTHADLTGANLRGARLGDVNLGRANLRNVRSGGITGTPSALPYDWRLLQGYLVGPEADLSNANLAGAFLTNAYLGYANLNGANLSHANLTKTNLAAVNLAGANLSYANLSVTYLGGANLTGANLTGVIWYHTTCPNGNLGPYPCS